MSYDVVIRASNIYSPLIYKLRFFCFGSFFRFYKTSRNVSSPSAETQVDGLPPAPSTFASYSDCWRRSIAFRMNSPASLDQFEIHVDQGTTEEDYAPRIWLFRKYLKFKNSVLTIKSKSLRSNGWNFMWREALSSSMVFKGPLLAKSQVRRLKVSLRVIHFEISATTQWILLSL